MIRLAAVLLCAPAFSQSLWYVDLSGVAPGTGTPGDPFTSIQYAVDAAVVLPGDVILVRAGTYFENVDLRGKDLVILSGTSTVTVNVQAVGGTGFSFRNGETDQCRIEGIRVIGGDGTSIGGQRFGGCVLIENGSPVLDSCSFQSGLTQFGGGVCVLGGEPEILGCQIRFNQAESGGGMYVEGGSVLVEDSLFYRNSIVSSLGSTSGGAVQFADSASGELRRTILRENRNRLGGGGGLAVLLGSGQVSVHECLFERNQAGFLAQGRGAGALAIGPLLCTDTEFVANGDDPGWSVFSGGGASGGHFSRCTFTQNRAQSGGGLSNAVAEDCVFRSNVACSSAAVARGGAAMECELARCDLEDNFSCDFGGAAVDSRLFDCNVVDNLGRDGAGGLQGGSATRCRIHGNRTGSAGYPSFSIEGGGALDVHLVLCEVTSNFSAEGGGLSGGSADRCSIIGNASLIGGGAWGAVVTNSVVWHNVPSGMSGGTTYEYSNVEGGLQPGLGNLSTDPLLHSSSGGDAHLLANSPCIDAASPTAPPDPDGSRADMGAVPYDPSFRIGAVSYCHGPDYIDSSTVTLCTQKMESSGAVSLSTGVTISAVGGLDASPALLLIGFVPGRVVVPKRSASGNERGVNTLCIGGEVLRAGPVRSAGTGSTNCESALIADLTGADLLGLGAFVGGTLHAQYWFMGQTQFSYPHFSPAIAIPIVP